MAAENNNDLPVDPFEPFRGMRDAYLEGMSKVMVNAVNSEEYAEATGAMLNGYLTLTAPFRDALDKAMIMALEQLSLPSRQQVTSLSERFTNFEMRLDDMDAKLDRLIELASQSRSPATEDLPAAKVTGDVTASKTIENQPAARATRDLPAAKAAANPSAAKATGSASYDKRAAGAEAKSSRHTGARKA